MAPARETYERIQQASQLIIQHLTRFTRDYIPSPESLKALISYRTQIQEQSKKAEGIYRKYTEPYNLEFQSETTRINQERQRESSAAKAAFQNKPGGLLPNDPVLQKSEQELEKKYSALLEELQQNIQRKNLDIDSPELESIELEINKKIDQVHELERALKGQELLQKTQQGLASHRLTFELASTNHRRVSWLVASVLLVILFSGAFILYKYFVINKIELPQGLSPGDLRFSVILMLFASGLSGKLAFLIAWGAALRYLADLYKRNSMQSVLYKDRSMALDIVEILLAITPQLEQKKELLATLSTGYLDFEQNAFHHSSTEKGNDGEIHVKQLKDAVDTIKPLFDSLRGALEKEKTK